LQDLGSWHGGGTPSKSDPAFWTGGTIPWVSPKDMKAEHILDTEDHITPAAVEASTASVLEAGAVLIVVRSGILRHSLPVAVSKVQVALNQDLKGMRPSSSLNPGFIAYALRRFEREILNSCTKSGTTVQSVEFPRFLRFQIPLAPLTEQHRIVAEIEKHFTRLDAAVASLKRVQANLKRYRAAVLKAACEGRLVPTEAELARAAGRDYEPAERLLTALLEKRRAEWRAERKAKLQVSRRWPSGTDRQPAELPGSTAYQEPPAADSAGLPALPTGWIWARLEQIVARSEYGTSVKCAYGAEGPPVLRIPNIANGRVDLTDLKRSTQPLALDSSRALRRGDILMCRTNGSVALIGKAAVVGMEFGEPHSFASYLLRFRLLEAQILPHWLHLYVSSPQGRSFIERHAASSAGQHNISLSLMHAMTLPLPPFAEQQRIVNDVERRLSVIDELEASIGVNLVRADRLRQSVLRRAFEGKLVPQDPDDEPAAALLERIRAERRNSLPARRTGRARQPRLL
jgi:type I restriction enzyme, S subunit